MQQNPLKNKDYCATMTLYFNKETPIMKKLLALLITLLLVFALFSCDLLPDELKDMIGLGSGSGDNGGEGEHVCEMVLVDTKAASCTVKGKEIYKCECGKKEEKPIEALGHDIQFLKEERGNCDQYGKIIHKCTRCKKTEEYSIAPMEHIWGELVEASRLIECTRDGCSGVKLADGNGKYAEALVFNFGDNEKAALEAKHNELLAILEAAEKYDPALHAYAEEGALADAYEEAYLIYEAYSDLIYSAQGQLSIANTLYYCDIRNSELEAIYNDMSSYYTDLVSKYFTLSQPWYDSMFRDYFFYGATEEEIAAFLFDSNAYANPEYTALKTRNDEIEIEFLALANPQAGNDVAILYAELVENNNRIAEILGYDNYLEYAYENVYDREYTYQDVAAFVEYVKEYIAPAYNRVYGLWDSVSGYNENDIEQYYNIVKYSFFENRTPNALFNDYIDDMNMAFISNPDKQISFSDNLNNLMSDGNLFRGTYEGAYVTFIRDGQIPLAYFGEGYDNTTTVAHEFGHYMNEIYNLSEYNQSYDLLETHSQGNEFLFIYYVEGKISDKAYELVELYQILSTLSTVMASVQVDCFEQAIYLDYYDGPNSDKIMADGTITYDEYDLLYASISEELGIIEKYQQNDYWRYGMTISAPCYYISYSVSAINALQLYAKIHTESFDAAKDSYLKLFTYTDVDPEMSTEEILEYAGLYSYNDVRAYEYISKFLLTN